MDLRLARRQALVTGGSMGIGRAIAKTLCEEGCKVVICARNEGVLEKTAKELGCVGIVADCEERRDVERVLTYTSDLGIDILVNNVGGGGSWGSEDYEHFREWERVYEKNAGAAIKFTMGCLPYMRKQNWGRVITIASIYGKEAGGRPWFNMANAAQISLMKNLAIKHYEGITFNTIAPGHIDVRKEMSYVPKIMGNPEDVANLAAFLCSDLAKHINGACIPVDGGESFSF